MGEQCSFRHASNDRAIPTPIAEPPSEPQSLKTRGRSVSRRRNARGRNQSEKFNVPPDYTTICRKGKRMLEPVRRVRFTRVALRQANIREKEGPSLGKIQVKIPHQRSPYAMRDCKTGAMRLRRCAGTCEEHLQAQKGRQSFILFAF